MGAIDNIEKLSRVGLGTGEEVSFEGVVTPTISSTENLVLKTTPSGGSATAALTVTSTGNVGVGTTAPAFSQGSGLEIERVGVTTLRLQNTDVGGATTELRSATGETMFVVPALAIGNGATEFFRVASGGQVLQRSNTARVFGTLGTLQFQQELPGASASLGLMSNRNDTGASTLYLGKSRSTANGGSGLILSGDQLGTIAFGGGDGSVLAEGVTLVARTDGTPAAGSMPARLEIRTTPSASATPVVRLTVNSTGVVTPGADNTQSLGSGGMRWSTVFAGTGTINTSDAREKTPVREMSPAEIDAAKVIASEFGVFQFLSAVEEKGDAARLHVGTTVQRVITILEERGLDPTRYAFICYDTWGKVEEDGVVIQEAGNRYGFRVDQLLMFVARGFEERLKALESK